MCRANCAVANCLNNSKKYKCLKEAPREIYTGFLKNDVGCEPLLPLYMFPSIKKNFDKRKARIKLLKRVTTTIKRENLVIMV